MRLQQRTLMLEHKSWGLPVPAVDIDHLLIEYDHARPTAIIEYKHENVGKVDFDKSAIKTLVKLGDMANLPVFVVVYKQNFTCWWVKALNDQAHRILPEHKRMTKKEYITFVYRIRGRAPGGALWRKLGLDK